MIKVVHITGSLGFGGVERVVAQLCDNLDHSRFEVHIISLSDNILLAKTIKNREKINIHTCGRPDDLGSFGLHFRSTFKMYRILNSIKPDIIHSHLYYLNNLAYALAKGIPHVITIHGPSIIAMRNRARQLLFAVANSGKRKSCHTIAVSHSVKNELVEHFRSNFSHIEVIHNGIDTEFFKPQGEKLSAQSEIATAIHIARHVKGKGIECLLRAWAKIGTQHGAKLLLVGDGPQHSEYKALANHLQIQRSVNFLGARDDVRELMQQADFGIFPSETEGMPMAPAEMMAMQLPVIGSDIEPLVELIAPPEAGDVVPVNDDAALAQKISRYLADEALRTEKGRRARQRIVQHFGLQQQAEKHESFYLKISKHA